MKTMLISGGSDGLGKAIAAEFVKTHHVTILAQQPEKTAQAAREIGCDYVVADVSDNAQVEKAVADILKKNGAINVLINNAGIWIQGALDANDPERLRRTIEVNSLGTMLLTRAVLPHMKAAKSGRIINVISQAGLYGKPERSVYNASKWAVTGFTKSMAMELAGSGVSICGLYPGPMKTRLFENAGVEKDMTGYMELPEVVRAVKFIVETPDSLTIPELGINPA